MGRWQRRLLRTVITQDHTLTKTLQLRNTTAHRRDQTQSPYNPTARPAPATAAKAADEKGSAFRQHYNKKPPPPPSTGYPPLSSGSTKTADTSRSATAGGNGGLIRLI